MLGHLVCIKKCLFQQEKQLSKKNMFFSLEIILAENLKISRKRKAKSSSKFVYILSKHCKSDFNFTKILTKLSKFKFSQFSGDFRFSLKILYKTKFCSKWNIFLDFLNHFRTYQNVILSWARRKWLQSRRSKMWLKLEKWGIFLWA